MSRVPIQTAVSPGTRTVARDVGRILEALGGLLVLSLVVPLVFGEFFVVPALLIAAAVPFGIGRALYVRYQDASAPTKYHGMVIAATGWLLVAVFGALPFFLVAWTGPALGAELVPPAASTPTLSAFRDPLNALFESMSGFTGTGLTMVDDESVLPHTLQWWRTFTEWVGGVGVIVLTTAILARPGSGSLTLYESEARSKKIHPSIVSTVRTIWWIFLIFTFVSIAVLWLAGMPLWDAINHAMTGLSTGGFSVTDASIGTYDSAVIDFALVPIMIAGSIAFPIHFLILKGELRNLYADLQTRWVFLYMGAGSIAVTTLLVTNGVYPVSLEAVRYGLFQFVSAATCTGFQTAVGLTTTALGEWPASTQLLLSGGMVVGGAAGSTVGGIKIIRALTLAKGIRFQVADVFYPESAVRRLKIGERVLTPEQGHREFTEAAIITLLWILFLLVAIVVLLVSLDGQYPLENVVFEVASAQGNVGLSTGITGPESLPSVAKVTFLFNMWVGRLEIIPILVTLRSAFNILGVYR